jgi:LPS export ABC transporter protein LptC
MKTTIILLFSTFLLFSCSVKYEESVRAESVVPEFTFTNVDLNRYESNKLTVKFTAEKLEQYKNSSESFAKNIEFSSYNKKNELTTEGSCNLLAANTDTEIYTLFDNIQVSSKEDNVKFYSDSLKWNAKTEQLTSGKSNTVKIQKDDATIYGSGFSASGVSKSFSFSGSVSGEIITKDNSENDTDETIEEKYE